MQFLEQTKNTTFIFSSFLLVNRVCKIDRKIQYLQQQSQHRYSILERRNARTPTTVKLLQRLLHKLQFSLYYSVFQTFVLGHLFGHINIFGDFWRERSLLLRFTSAESPKIDDILVLFSTIVGKTLNNTNQFFPLVLEVKILWLST